MKTGQYQTNSKKIVHYGIFINPLIVLFFAAVVFYIKMWPIGIIILLTDLIYLIHCIIVYKTTAYLNDGNSNYISIGFFNKIKIELNECNKESIQIKQSFIGGILNYGTVIIRGIGTGEFTLNYIDNPGNFIGDSYAAEHE